MQIETYARIRGKLRTGDVIGFEALPFRAVVLAFERGFLDGLRTLFGWVSNHMIVAAQWRGNVDGDGLERFCHVLMVYVHPDTDEVMGIEYQAGMKSLVPIRLSEKICDYISRGGKVSHFPLNNTARRRTKTEKMVEYCTQRRQNGYNFLGLAFAELHILRFRGRTNPRRSFCSEGCKKIWMFMGTCDSEKIVWKRAKRRMPGGKYRWETGWSKVQVEAHQYSVAEILRDCAINRKDATQIVRTSL